MYAARIDVKLRLVNASAKHKDSRCLIISIKPIVVGILSSIVCVCVFMFVVATTTNFRRKLNERVLPQYRVAPSEYARHTNWLQYGPKRYINNFLSSPGRAPGFEERVRANE